MVLKKTFGNPENELWNYLLLFLVFFLVFIVAILPNAWHDILYNIAYTALFLTTIMVMGKGRLTIFLIAVVASAMGWISSHYNLDLLEYISIGINFCFFTYLTFHFIRKIAKADNVNLNVIMDAIIGYLMLGIVFSIMVAFIVSVNPALYNFKSVDNVNDEILYFQEYLYYGFITLTTTGYGDIVPLQSFSRSLAILISVTGQLYLTIIVALLVGKYASKRN
ncbi:MAG: two pore domain potassium channel family protein [Bacteroidales bacterium]|nr:two pore domain potassium channel family protein [Bacteroidota bacterium]MBL6949200.1 two pore domain potassium channel family protein [Bacteroidales bacterium]